MGETNDLGDMYLCLQRAGHDVRVHVSDVDSRDVMGGMLDLVEDWRQQIDWIRDAGADGFVLFETASAGEIQDQLRKEGLNVIGGSAFGDRLETDRAFGQETLRKAGLRTAGVYEFRGLEDAASHVRHRPGRYVLKLSGSNWPSSSTYAGQMESGRDMIALISTMHRNWRADEEPQGVLMDFVPGVEVGVGAFFNGERFLQPANLDWEHKRFFPGDLGELTGEMGTVVTYRGAEKLFHATLENMAPMLAESGYCGYINLNTMVNEEGVWPLEFTCRFGYPGFAILGSLHEEGWGSIFKAMTLGGRHEIMTKDGLSIGVVVTVPSFPYRDGYDELGKGTPVSFDDSMSEADMDELHFGEVAMSDGQLVTAGLIGYVMVVTGIGGTIDAARADAYGRVSKVIIPNARYRNDIGSRFESDCATLRRLGWLP